MGGELDARSSTFQEQFNATSLEVGQNLFLREQANFNEVILTYAKVGGGLDARDSTFQGQFNAENLEVSQNLFLRNGVVFKKAVILVGAKVEGTLDASNSTFQGRFNAENLEVASDLFLSAGATFKEVNLVGAKVGGGLQLQGGAFASGLNLTGAEVKEDFLLNQDRKVPIWENKSSLILRNTSVGALQDRKDSWDNLNGRLDIAGFTYQQLGGLRSHESTEETIANRSVEDLLYWLSKQRGFNENHNSQPFQQLADTLRKAGYDDKADDIMVAKINHYRDTPKTPYKTRLWLWIEYLFSAYGYEVFRPLKFLTISFLILIFSGLLFTYCGSNQNSDQNNHFRGRWHRIGYSFDQAIPLVSLDDRNKRIKLYGCGWAYFYFHRFVGFVGVSALMSIFIAIMTELATKG